LRCLQRVTYSESRNKYIERLTTLIENNYQKGSFKNPYHPKAYEELEELPYWMASLNPSGYQTMFDALGNAIALLLNLGTKVQNLELISFSETLRNKLPLKLLPAFWKPIEENDQDWGLLKNNCKYEFRNHPYEFHNGGTWQMVNGFYGMALCTNPIYQNATNDILRHIKNLNQKENNGYYENFNSKTSKAIGIKYCTWSAAGEILLEAYINGKKLLS
ncbi:MAG: glycoside hydrolase 100 family protein, partial [Nonlabens sp.]